MLDDGSIAIRLDEDQLRQVVSELLKQEVEAVAVSFLHSFRNPDHERRVARVLAEKAPGITVSLSSDVAPEIREYERTSTTIANVYVRPLVERYLRVLDERLTRLGFGGSLYVMLSNGGTASVETAREFPIRLLESGPAAGALAAAFYGLKTGFSEVLSFDMGGTTAKACLIEGGEPLTTSEFEVARVYRLKKGSGLPLKTSVVEMIEIGAGGGSIARVGPLGLPKVGPESAGANPGPACYGRGGRRPTVTDANLLLGRLPAKLADGLELDVAAAEQALERLDPADVVSVVNAEMLRALRVVSVERGLDAGDFALVAFGGAGPLHACELADELGISTVLVPDAAGVLSALGLAVSDERRDRVRSEVRPLGEIRDLPAEGEADLRYRGQSFELSVPLGPELEERFHRLHEERYGYADRARELELVAVRTAEVKPGPALQLPAGEPEKARGPAMLELDGATCWL